MTIVTVSVRDPARGGADLVQPENCALWREIRLFSGGPGGSIQPLSEIAEHAIVA